MRVLVAMQRGVSILPEYEFMKPACDFNLTNVSEQTHLCSTDPWGEGIFYFGGGGVAVSVGGWFMLPPWTEVASATGNEIFYSHLYSYRRKDKRRTKERTSLQNKFHGKKILFINMR